MSEENGWNRLWNWVHGWGGLMDLACVGASWQHPVFVTLKWGLDCRSLTMTVVGHKIPDALSHIDLRTLAQTAFDGQVAPEELEARLAAAPTTNESELPIHGLVWHLEQLGWTGLAKVFQHSSLVRLAIFQDKVVKQLLKAKGRLEYSWRDEDVMTGWEGWELVFHPEAHVDLGGDLETACLQRVCAFGEALQIQYGNRLRKRRNGVRFWLNLTAPSRENLRGECPGYHIQGKQAFALNRYDGMQENHLEVFVNGHRVPAGEVGEVMQEAIQETLADWPPDNRHGFFGALSLHDCDEMTFAHDTAPARILTGRDTLRSHLVTYLREFLERA